MKKSVILGNIITMDERRPTAKAALVRDGVFAYIGDAAEAKKLAGADAQILDYGENFIYPGFLDGHAHGCFAGYRAIGQANLAQAGLTDYARYRKIIKDFIAKNPQREIYLAAGWIQNSEPVTKAYLDEICADKPLIMNTGDAHSCLLNTKALEWAGIDAAYAKKYGYDLVHVDENGEPTGFICEGPAFAVMHDVPVSVEDAKNYILAWQDFAISNGLTATAFAGDDLRFPEAEAYYQLEQEGRLKLRTYANVIIPDNAADPKAEIASVVETRAKYSSEYYNIIGAKVLLDGVVEAHTGWMIDDYKDQPGYHGVERFNDHDKMVALIVAADAEGLSVHAHSVGNGATKTVSKTRKKLPATSTSATFWLTCSSLPTKIFSAWRKPAPWLRCRRFGLRKCLAIMIPRLNMSAGNGRITLIQSSHSSTPAPTSFFIRIIPFRRLWTLSSAFTWRKSARSHRF